MKNTQMNLQNLFAYFIVQPSKLTTFTKLTSIF